MPPPHPAPGPGFHPTRWSLICTAQNSDPTLARTALGELCQTYWSPLYAYLRHDGHDEHTAMDLVQGFLTQLLATDGLPGADAAKGRFRSYLLGALKHFVHKQIRADAALKRGGGQPVLTLDGATAESQYNLDAVLTDTPDRAFDRQFALAVLDRSLAKVEEDYRERGRSEVFARLAPYLGERPEPGEYRRAAADLSLDETVIKVTVHRMRTRMRHHLLAELGQTTANPADLDRELAALFAALEKTPAGR